MKTLFIFFASILIYLSGFSQTTMEEYNFITKDYQIQLPFELGMKEGYILKDYYSYKDTVNTDFNALIRNINFKALYKTGVSKPVALMMIWERTDNNYKEYFCIPQTNSSKEVWQEAKQHWHKKTGSWGKSVNHWNKVYENSAAIGYYYSWGMIKFISFQFSK